MSRKPKQQSQPKLSSSAQPAAAKSRGRAKTWTIVAVGVAGVIIIVALALLAFPRPFGPRLDEMVWVPGGTFWMGSEEFADASPIHEATVDCFWMDRTEVTNAQFAKFVAATGYVTVVERPLDATKFKGAADVQPFSLVFQPPGRRLDLAKAEVRSWWRVAFGAFWKHPEGPLSNIKNRAEHPAVHICYDDAQAYAQWAGKRLPTEAEWEFAFRGSLDRKPFAWGDTLMPDGKPMANVWQGDFPNDNTGEDRFTGTAPVGSYAANGFGLYDMSGNVWEWCADWYQPKYLETESARNPQGPPSSFDPTEPGVAKRVQRGGSFLCCDNFCIRYKSGARGKGDPESSANHIGFRCVRSAEAVRAEAATFKSQAPNPNEASSSKF